MKIAYCIICHKNTNILRTAIEILSKDNDIYIHVDKKSQICNFDEYATANVKFIGERIDVRWGSYSQIECMLALLKEAMKKDYSYICLLSGDCLPLKNSDKIKKIFEKYKGEEYIGIVKIQDEAELENKIKYENSLLDLKTDKNIFEEKILKIQKILGLRKINKYYKLLPTIYKGCNWFCISKQLSKYIFEFLSKNEWYKDAFRKSKCGDEIFFQTIVMNSEFSNKIHRLDSSLDDNLMALRYIDWKSGPEYPKILTEDDFYKIKSSDCIFGRKFSENIDIDLYKKTFGIE